MLHFLELPFRHYYEYIAGKTTGPNTLEGAIGEAISDKELTSQPIVNFTPLTANIPVLDCEEVKSLKLTSDQKYLYDLVRAIQAWFY